MVLRITTAPAVAADTPFQLVVPGQQVWRLKSVCAVLSRAVGGVPTRRLQLSVTDGTTTVLVSPANDAGTEPGTLTVTWANAAPSAVASGTTGISLGPLSPMVLFAGYTIVGTVVGGVAADQWTSAVAWWDDGAPNP